MSRGFSSSLFARFSLAGFRFHADARVILQGLMGQSLGGHFKPIACLRHVEPLGQDRMRLQAGVFADELGMKLPGRAYQEAVPGFFAGSQYEHKPSE